MQLSACIIFIMIALVDRIQPTENRKIINKKNPFICVNKWNIIQVLIKIKQETFITGITPVQDQSLMIQYKH
jgi:hypothetical protein